ncbi:hypothetical protein ZWY2020_034346 [Hordeum vulgare]|nr:hypothetical protein ZWY2020_034346 [Hordeum vulgare]
MADLVAEVAKITTITVTAENQEEVNNELTKLREEMDIIHRDIEGEAARMATQRAKSTAETERLNAEGWRLERQQRASDAIHQRRHHNRLPADLNPIRLFDSPHTPRMEPNRTWQVAPRVDPAQPPPNPQATQPAAACTALPNATGSLLKPR